MGLTVTLAGSSLRELYCCLNPFLIRPTLSTLFKTGTCSPVFAHASSYTALFPAPPVTPITWIFTHLHNTGNLLISYWLCDLVCPLLPECQLGEDRFLFALSRDTSLGWTFLWAKWHLGAISPSSLHGLGNCYCISFIFLRKASPAFLWPFLYSES